MLVETNNVAEKSELNFAGIMFRRAKGSGTTKALRNFEIVNLLDNGIFGALGSSSSISTINIKNQHIRINTHKLALSFVFLRFLIC